MRRTDQRRAAVWALYQSDLLDRPLEQTLGPGAHPFTRELGEEGYAAIELLLDRAHQAGLVPAHPPLR